MDIASFASAAAAWILTHLVAILAWLGTLLVGVFAAWLNYHFRAQGRIREAHHAEIKEEVLKPLLQGVDSLLALLEQRRPPVVIGNERVEEPEDRPRAVETPRVRHRDVLWAAVPQAGTAPWLGSPAEPAGVDQRLYECAREHHLPDLIRTLEDLAARVGAYCERCLGLAQDLQEALTAGAPVRTTVFRPAGEPPWLNPLRLARYVLDRRLGYSPSWLDRSNTEGMLRTPDGMVVCHAPRELDACVALVDGLLPDDGTAAALLAEARTLASEVPAVREAVEDALRMGRLEGRCQYLRSRGLRSRARSWWRRARRPRAVRTTPLAGLLIFISATLSFAHGGGLDAYGCHHDRRLGSYHCHRGSFAGRSFSSKGEMLGVLQQTEESRPRSEPTPSSITVKVVRVVDGDTIDVCCIQGKEERIRYIGINTPETRHPSKGVEYYGREAAAANRRLVAGNTVHLEFDVQLRDSYRRLLAYVYLEDGTFVNAWLVEHGYAQVMTVPPNVRHQDLFLRCQQQAREAGRGLWGVR